MKREVRVRSGGETSGDLAMALGEVGAAFVMVVGGVGGWSQKLASVSVFATGAVAVLVADGA